MLSSMASLCCGGSSLAKPDGLVWEALTLQGGIRTARSCLPPFQQRRLLHGTPTAMKGLNQTYRAQGPVYMRLRDYPIEKKNWEGIPIEDVDWPDTREGFKGFKTRNALWQSQLDKTLMRFSHWAEWKKPNQAWIDKKRRPPVPAIPPVIPVARDGMTVEKFLKTIGRGLDQHTSKFKSWEHLFSCKSPKLKEMGVGLRERKYLLRWLENYRQGQEPKYEPLKSKAHKYKNLEWRLQLITQKDLRKQYGLD